MLAVAIAVAMSVLVTSIANIALPTIAHDMRVTPAQSIWVVNAYQLAVTVTLLPFASMGDIYGHGGSISGASRSITAASLVCALAPSLPVLVVGRVLQGFGGAGIMSVNGALVRFIFPRAMLGRGIGFNALVVAGSSAAGPIGRGGDHVGAVLALAVRAAGARRASLRLVAGARFLPQTPRAGHPFDPLSAVLNAVTFGLFITALDGVGRGQSGSSGLSGTRGSIVVGWFFVQSPIYAGRADAAGGSVPPPGVRAVGRRPRSAPHGAQLIAFVALPFYFQYVSGLSPIQIGVLITPWPPRLVVMAPIAGRLADRYSAGLLGGFGLAVMTLGLLLVLFLPARPAQIDVAWRIGGVRHRLRVLPVTQQPADDRQRATRAAGAGSGMLSTSRLLGQTTGSALVALVFGIGAATGSGIAGGVRLSLFAGMIAAGGATLISFVRVGHRAEARRG